MNGPETTAADYVERLERQQFGYLLQLATPKVWVYRALIAANALVFVVMLGFGVGLLWPDPVSVIPWANFAPYTADGEWWRVLTCTFVHFGIVHIAVNMYALKILGPLLERLYGNVAFLTLYVLAGAGGSLTSLVFHPGTPSAGASGAIFGLIGGILGFVVVARRSIPPTVFRNLRNAGLKLAGINLALGFLIPFIDNAAHTGGLVVGLLAGLCLGRRLPPAPGRHRARYVRAALLAAALLASAWPIGRHVRGHPDAALAGAAADFEFGRLDRALARLDAAIAAHPDNATLYLARAEVHEKRGQRGLALADAERACALDPENREAARLYEKLRESVD